jgi:phospholipid/cholesterol/gamma-HCH transport system permease protein
VGVRRVSLWRLIDRGEWLVCDNCYDRESDGHTQGSRLARADLPQLFMVELGAMRTGGQVHLLDAQGIDPFLYLVVPRVLATALGVFCLTMVFLVVALATGLVAAHTLGLTSLTLLDFLAAVLTAMGPREYALIPLKTLAIGFAIGLISCTTGLAVGRVVPEVAALLPRGFVKAVLATLLISGGLTMLL